MVKFLLLSSFFLTTASFGQTPFWMQTSGPSAGPSYIALNSHGDIFDLNRSLIRSTDKGASWNDILPSFLRTVAINGWGISQDNIYFWLEKSFYRSTDNGITWSQTLQASSGGYYFYYSPTGPLYLYRAGISDSTMLRSVDGGASWVDITTKLPKGLSTDYYPSITQTGEIFLTGYQQTNIYSSSNNGDSWNLTSTVPYRFESSIQGGPNGSLFCGNAILDSATDVLGGFTVRSTDNGKTWDSIATLLNPVITPSNIICGTSMNDDSIHISTDNGNSWAASPIADGHPLFNASGVTDQNGNIYWSIDDRATVLSISTRKITEFPLPIAPVYNLLVTGNNIVLAGGSRFFSTSSDGGASWQTTTGIYDSVYCGNFTNYALDSSGGILACGYSSIFRSTDLGKSWIDKGAPQCGSSSDGDFLSDHKMMVAPNGNIFACSADSNLIRSTDLGTTWKTVALGLPTNPASAIACTSDGTLYTFIHQTIYRSTNNGNSWQTIVNIADPFLAQHISATSDISTLITTANGDIIVGTTGNGILRSTDGGLTWNVINEYVGSANVSALFAAPNGDVYGIITSGTLPPGLIARPYNANRWYSANDGLGTVTDLTTMAFSANGVAYLGTNGRGMFRSQGVLNAVHSSDERFDLVVSSIPNPTTSKTTITYSLPEQTAVTLELFDALGKSLQTCIHQIQDAGAHSAHLELGGYSSGVYFLRLRTLSGSATTKIVLK